MRAREVEATGALRGVVSGRGALRRRVARGPSDGSWTGSLPFRTWALARILAASCCSY